MGLILIISKIYFTALICRRHEIIRPRVENINPIHLDAGKQFYVQIFLEQYVCKTDTIDQTGESRSQTAQLYLILQITCLRAMKCKEKVVSQKRVVTFT